MVSDTLIKIRNVTKRYGKTIALRGVSLDIGERTDGCKVECGLKIFINNHVDHGRQRI